jgi:hypothetical protein
MGLPVGDGRSAVERVPDVWVAAVHERLNEFFESEQLPRCSKPLSASEVVKRLTLFLGGRTINRLYY